MSPCVAVPYHLLAHSRATRASVWAVRHFPGPWESLSAPTESMKVEVGRLIGPAQLPILPSATLYQIRHFSVAVAQDTKYFISETTLQVSDFRHSHLCWWPRVCKKGSLALLFGGKPCPNCCPFTVDLAPAEDPHCPRRHLTSLLSLVGITGRKAPHLDPSCAWLAD